MTCVRPDEDQMDRVHVASALLALNLGECIWSIRSRARMTWSSCADGVLGQ